MVSVSPGTGATINANTAEGQAFAIVCFLAAQEKDAAKNPTNIDNVSWSVDEGLLEWTGSFSVQLTRTTDATGASVYKASSYLSGVTFSPGTNGTFKSTNEAQYLYEVIEFLQDKERDPLSNTQGQNRVLASLNTDTLIYSGTIRLAITSGLNTVSEQVNKPVAYLA